MTTVRDRIRAASTRRVRAYECEVLGNIHIRSITLAEASTLPDENETAALIAAAVCDADGRALFGPDDMEMLSLLDARLAKPLLAAINDHCLPDTEGAKKN